jgi:hypothetical protein
VWILIIVLHLKWWDRAKLRSTSDTVWLPHIKHAGRANNPPPSSRTVNDESERLAKDMFAHLYLSETRRSTNRVRGSLSVNTTATAIACTIDLNTRLNSSNKWARRHIYYSCVFNYLFTLWPLLPIVVFYL